MISHLALPTVFVAMLTGSLEAQNIYVDFGPAASPTPSSNYGAALGIPGYWNKVSGTANVPLLDINAQSTGANLNILVGSTSFTTFLQPGLTGDDAALLDSFMMDGAAPIEMLVTLPPAHWQFLFFGAPEFGFQFGQEMTDCFLFNGAGESTQDIKFDVDPFLGTYVGWSMGSIVVDTSAPGSGTIEFDIRGGVAGMQLVRLEDATFCGGNLGDCPCGNVGQPQRGCPSSIDPAGAQLSGSGSMQVSNDSLQLVATSMTNSVVTVFQGTATANNARGVPFGDGLRCAGGTTVRLASKPSIGGVLQYPGSGDQPVSVRGGVPPAGGFRTYQVWYRNAGSFCTSSTFNLTNGIAVRWLP